VPLFHDPRFTNASARNTVFADTTMELDATVRRLGLGVFPSQSTIISHTCFALCSYVVQINTIWQAVKDAGQVWAVHAPLYLLE
jgi:hypothetical protein